MYVNSGHLHSTVGRICDRLMDESGQEALTDKGILEGVGGTECGGNERGHGEQRSCRTHDESRDKDNKDNGTG